MKRFQPLERLSEEGTEDYDALPLKEAIHKLPKDLKEVVILRYFTGYTLAEWTADKPITIQAQ